jgi:hypothetical protein
MAQDAGQRQSYRASFHAKDRNTMEYRDNTPSK